MLRNRSCRGCLPSKNRTPNPPGLSTPAGLDVGSPMTGSRCLQTLGLAGLLGVIGGTALADCSRRSGARGELAALPAGRAGPARRRSERGDAGRRLLQADRPFRRRCWSGADARRAKFVSAIMRDVDLDQARLIRADLTKADLTGASLQRGRSDQRAPVPRRSEQGQSDQRPARRCRPAQGDVRRRDLDRRQDRVRRELDRSVQPVPRAAEGQRRRAERLTPAAAALPDHEQRSGASPGRGAGRAAAPASRARARRCARRSARPPRTCQPACRGR